MEIKDNKRDLFNSKLMIIWIFTIFFDSYYIFKIANFPVTVFVLFSVIVIGYNLLTIIKNGKLKLENIHLIAFLIIVYVIFNYFFTGLKNVNSLILTIFFFTTFIITKRTEEEKNLGKYLKFFNICMNIMAVYGIYQFIGRIYGLPLSDIIIKDHMVEGFNWTNQIQFMGKNFFRSNAIFREPSFFSQYLAVNLLIIIKKMLDSNNKKLYVLFELLINSIAMILSFSGTGLIILIVGGIIYLFKLNKNKKIKKNIAIYGIILFIGIQIILNSTIGDYYTKRISEIFEYTEDNYSGYVRFRSGNDVLNLAWKENILFGIGIGTVDEFISSINTYKGTTVNGFYRPAIELGLIGIVLWLIFIFSISMKKNRSQSLLVIQCIIIPMLICHEAFLSNYYWIFLYMLNFKIIDKKEYNKIEGKESIDE